MSWRQTDICLGFLLTLSLTPSSALCGVFRTLKAAIIASANQPFRAGAIPFHESSMVSSKWMYSEKGTRS